MSGAGKGSRPRRVDLKKYGEHFDAIFAKNKKNIIKTPNAIANSVLMDN